MKTQTFKDYADKLLNQTIVDLMQQPIPEPERRMYFKFNHRPCSVFYDADTKLYGLSVYGPEFNSVPWHTCSQQFFTLFPAPSGRYSKSHLMIAYDISIRHIVPAALKKEAA